MRNSCAKRLWNASRHKPQSRELLIVSSSFERGLSRLKELHSCFEPCAYSSHETEWTSREWLLELPYSYKGRKSGRIRGEELYGLLERRNYVERIQDKQLSRSFVRREVLAAGDSSERLVDAFVAVMAWGFKPGSYGPYRTSVMLSPASGLPTPNDVLPRAVKALNDEGPLAGYKSMFKKLEQCGPAFGTKFLYFASPDGNRAPILDDVVARWMVRHSVRHESGRAITSEGWNTGHYSRYLEFVAAATSVLSESDAGVIEYLMFTDQLYFEFLTNQEKFPRWIADLFHRR